VCVCVCVCQALGVVKDLQTRGVEVPSSIRYLIFDGLAVVGRCVSLCPY